MTEQRFTLKDFFLFLALAVLCVILLSAMYMVDRQWQKMSMMQDTMAEQAMDLRQLKSSFQSLERQIQGGLTLQNDQPEDAIPAAFGRAYKATQQTDYSEGGWLVQAFGVNLKSVTPFISEDAYASEIHDYILESLLTRNPDTLAWQGLLARSWVASADGLTFTFDLRKDLKFSDGTSLTAKDVAFSFKFIMDQSIRAPRERAYFSKIESVEAMNDHRVVFQFKEPYFRSLSLAGGMPVLAEHFYGPYLEAPNDYNQSKGLLLGSGPYRLPDPKGWTPDKGFVELERNPRYWGKVQPSFDRMIWKVIENDSARLTSFRNGEVDVYGARPREYQRLLDDPALTKKAVHKEYMSPVGGYSYIGWNQKRKDKPTFFSDKRVRQAMTFVTDREGIAKDIFLGYAEVAVGPFNPLGKQHDPSLRPRKYSIESSRQLLEEAGFEDRDGDSILEDKNGNPFKFELVYVQSNDDTKRLVLYLKDLYKRAGILLIPKPTEWSVMLDLLKKRDFDAITLGWTGSLEGDLYQIFHSSQIADSGNNNIHFRNEKLDRLIEEARSTVDEAQRMPLWRQAEAIIYDEQPYTFLVRRKSLAFIDKRIRNLQKTKVGLNLGVVPIEIYIASAQQKH